jgi:hypothetical protein
MTLKKIVIYLISLIITILFIYIVSINFKCDSLNNCFIVGLLIIFSSLPYFISYAFLSQKA